jgi:hypothetical protein
MTKSVWVRDESRLFEIGGGKSRVFLETPGEGSISSISIILDGNVLWRHIYGYMAGPSRDALESLPEYQQALNIINNLSDMLGAVYIEDLVKS